MFRPTLITSLIRSTLIAYGSGVAPPVPTTLKLTKGTLTEESSPVGTIVSTYTLTHAVGAAITVNFSSGTNLNGYYELSGTNVLLTTVGVNALDIGTVMPDVSLTTSDGVMNTNNVTTVLIDDETFLTVTNGTITQGTTVAGDVVCTFTASDEDDVLTFAFTSGTNTGGYYAISGFDILLTNAGETFLNASNEMPNVSITTNTGKTASNTITTVNVAAKRWAPTFNGTSQYMDVASRTYAGDFYFSFDVISTEKSKDWAVWDSVTFNNSSGAEALLYMDAPDGVEILFNSNGIQGKFERYIFGGQSKICDGVKHTVKIERIGSTMNMWVDGVIFSTVNNVSTASIIVPNKIFGGNARYFKGIAYNADFNGIKFPMNEPFHQYPTLTSSTGTIMSAKNFVTANVVEITE